MDSHTRGSLIGFDGSRLSGRARTGTESYAFELLKRLVELAEPDELLVYLNASAIPEDLPPGVTTSALSAPRLWTHGRLSWEMARRPPKVLLVPSHVIPAIHPRSVVTIHDLAYLAHPEAFGVRQCRELDLATRWNVNAAARIVAVSRRTRIDLVERYCVDPEKILVIHHGVDARFRPVEEEGIDRIRETYGLDGPYLLSVGTLHPRKNQQMLIAGFEQAANGRVSHDLVICGAPGPASDSIHRQISSSPLVDRIHYLNYVPLEELPALYSGAALFMLPSLYEGFGMTGLEAMACGTPVLAAARGALPEICGHAARFFDPESPETVAEAITGALSSPEVSSRYAELGKHWASRFTWERAAGMTLNVLRAVRDGQDMSEELLGWSDLAQAPTATGINDRDET